MTKLLILTYDFPPYISVGGLRPYSWYKYLHLFDVHPIVVTRQWSNKETNRLDYISPGYSESVEVESLNKGILIRVPFKPTLANKILLKYGEDKFKLLRKMLTLSHISLQYSFPVGSMQEIYSAAEIYIKNNKIDCIIASGDPFILFKYASKLSKKYSIPWIADYRDSWVQDSTMSNPLYKKWNAYLERNFLENTSRITTVSKFIQKQIEQNVRGKQFEIIFNGYDPEIISTTKHIKQESEILSIVFNGTLQNWNPIKIFLRVCNELIREDEKFKLKLNFYGLNKEQDISDLIEQKYKNLKPYVYFYPRMDNIEYAKSISAQNIFLLFNDYSIIGTKIFDYLALKRKILFCFENDKEALKLREKYFFLDEFDLESSRSQLEVLKDTNSAIVVKDSKHLKQVLRDLEEELKERGFIACPSVNVEKYSRVKQVKHLAEIVKGIEKT